MCGEATAREQNQSEDGAFGFPFPPYPLQRALMANVHRILETGGVGIFESPTGTGKTLALLCPALSWLRKRERALLLESATASSAARDGEARTEPDLEDWARLHRDTMAQATVDSTWRHRKQQREQRRLRAKKATTLTSSGTTQRDKIRRVALDVGGIPEGEAEFELEAPLDLPQLEPLPDLEEQTTVDAYEEKLQIIFCSRTHSQLTQVQGEIRRMQEASPDVVPEDLAVISLGARSNLCVNDAVRTRARGSAAHLNELCRLATEKADKAGACTLKKQAHVIADAALTQILDIEGMVQHGRRTVGGGCPYFGSRQAAREADVLLVPYASLVNKEMRTKLGIRTQGNILIFDEAHNLLEAVNDANSVTLTTGQARASVEDLDMYAAKYEARLSPSNAMHLRQLRQLCMNVHRYLGSLVRSSAHTVGGFLVELGLDHFNLPELSHFLQVTELPRKVRGYVESRRVQRKSNTSSASSSIYGFAELLGALQHSTADDRILLQSPTFEGECASMRYLSLDAESRFRDLITSARSVIFTGGTLEPRAEFAPLYAQVAVSSSVEKAIQKRVSHFAGKHIVPEDHIFARYVTHGPSGHALDFRKDQRGTTQTISELKAILQSAAMHTPGGCVVFFPSFEYLASIASVVGARIGGREVFVETRSSSHSGADEEERIWLSGDKLLQAFAAAVHRDGGAMLLACSGAKLSEGINFKDNLCRLVGVVGLPYPNASDLALIEKMRFLDSRRSKGLEGLSGREFYSARCMKAVNQCVGRSIRHAQDWAAVLLLDHRYPQTNVRGAISSWLRNKATAAQFVDSERDFLAFFSERLKNQPGVIDQPTPAQQQALSISPHKQRNDSKALA